MENLCQPVSVTELNWLRSSNGQNYAIVCPWTVVRPNFTSLWPWRHSLWRHGILHRDTKALKMYFAQNLRRRRSPFWRAV